ncbi:MAG: hypothetical protein DRQ10_02580, partial [Candidatus Hydrothermota bacterium]
MWRNLFKVLFIASLVGALSSLKAEPRGRDLEKSLKFDPNATIMVKPQASIQTSLIPSKKAWRTSKEVDTLLYDDGEIDGGWYFGGSGNGFGMLFDAHGSVTLQGVFVNLYPGYPGDFQVMIVDDDGDNHTPGTIWFTSDTISGTDDWNYVDLTPYSITIPDGRFYVFYIQIGTPPNCGALSIDLDAGYPDRFRWIYYASTGTFSPDDNADRSGGAWFIRPVVDLTPFDYDAAAWNILSPESWNIYNINEPITPEVVVLNGGTQAATFTTHFEIYDETKALVYSESIQSTLSPGEYDTLQFSSWTPTAVGTYYTVVYTELTGDQSTGNDTLVDSFQVNFPVTYVESFEAGQVPPTGWSQYKIREQSSPGWIIYPNSAFLVSIDPFDGNYAAGHNDDNLPDSCDDWLVTPPLYVDPVGGSFSFYYATHFAPGYTGYRGIWISTGSPDPNDGDYVELLDMSDTASSDAWTRVTFDLSSYAGDTVYIAFRYIGDYSDEWVIDYVVGRNVYAPELHDVGVTSILAPVGVLQLGQSVTPQVVVSNFGNAEESFYTHMRIVREGDKSVVYEDSVLVTLPMANTATVDFPSWTPDSSGEYTVLAYTTLTDDDNTSNDTSFASAVVPDSVENFETSDGGFTPDPATGAWEWGVPTYGPSSAYSGSNVWGTVLDGEYDYDADWYLYSPTFTVTSNYPVFGFYHWYSIETSYDFGYFEYSTDAGVTWDTLGVYTGSSEWTAEIFPLAPMAGVAQGDVIQFRWHFVSDDYFNYPGWYIDDVFWAGLSPLVISHDVAVQSIDSPTFGIFEIGDTLIVQATVANNGVNTESFDVVLDVVSAKQVYSDTVIVSDLPSGEAQQVTFDPYEWATEGTYTIYVYTTLPNDNFPDNDTATMDVHVYPTPSFTESFEGGTVPPSGWTQYITGDSTAGWRIYTGDESWTTTSTPPIDGDYAAGHNDDDVSNECDDWLVSPLLHVDDVAALSFFYMTHFTPSYPGYHGVWVSTGSPDPADSDYVEVLDLTGIASENEWSRTVVDLSAYTGQYIYIAFRYRGDWDDEWFIDDIRGYGLTEVSVVDVSAKDILEPSLAISCGTPVTPTAVVANYSYEAKTFSVIFTIDDLAKTQVYYDSTEVTVDAQATDTISFSEWTPSTTGGFIARVYTILAGDMLPGNDTVIDSFVVFEILEDFEASDGGYTTEPDTVGWEWGVPTYGPPGAHSGVNVWATVLDDDYDNNADWKLISPTFIATQDEPVLVFYHWYDMEASTYYAWDGGNVKFSTDGGATWQLVEPIGGYPYVASHYNSAIPGEPCFSGQTDGWEVVIMPLIGVLQGQEFQIMFHFGSGSSYTCPGWYIDDIGGYGFALSGVHDVGVTQIVVPADGANYAANSVITPQVWVKNFGDYPETDVPVAIQITQVKGVNPVSASFIDDASPSVRLQRIARTNVATHVVDEKTFVLRVKQTIAPGESLLVELPPELLGDPGDYIAAAYTELPGDADPTNDTSYVTFSVNYIDVGVTDIVEPSSPTYNVGDRFTPEVSVENFGNVDVTTPVIFEIWKVGKKGFGGVKVAKAFDDGAKVPDELVYVDTVDLTVAGYDSAHAVFDEFTPGEVGTYRAVAYTDLAEDMDRSNDTAAVVTFEVEYHDVAVQSIEVPDTEVYLLNDVITPRAVVVNNGSVEETFDVHAVLESAKYQSVRQVTLGAGESVEVEFDELTFDEGGNFNFVVYTDLAGDQDNTNDTLTFGLFVEVHDIALTAINEPAASSYMTGQYVFPAVEVSNLGNVHEDVNVYLNVLYNSTSVHSGTVSLGLDAGETRVAVFDSFAFDQVGEYEFVFYVNQPIDLDRSNDTLTKTVSTEYHDVGVVEIFEPSDSIYNIGDVITPMAAFANYSSVEETFTVTAEIVSDEVVYSHDIDITLGSGETDTVAFDAFTIGEPGGYTVLFYTTLATDQDPSNDTLATEFIVPEYHEPDTMSVFEPDTLATGTAWEFGEPNPDLGPPGGAYEGDNTWGTELDGYYDNNVDQRLYTSIMNVTGDEPAFVFWHWYDFASGDSGVVEIWTETGGWQSLMTFTGSIGDWERVYVPLGPLGLH